MTGEVEKFQFDTIALPETEKLGQEIIEFEGAFFSNIGSRNRRLGIGFMVNKDLKASVVEFKPVSHRRCILKLRGKHQDQ